MSLEDRTNETVLLSLHEGEGVDGYEAAVDIDVEFDSSLDPQWRVWFMFTTEDEPWFKMTLEEAGLIHDRLGLILGRSGTEAGPDA